MVRCDGFKTGMIRDYILLWHLIVIIYCCYCLLPVINWDILWFQLVCDYRLLIFVVMSYCRYPYTGIHASSWCPFFSYMWLICCGCSAITVGPILDICYVYSILAFRCRKTVDCFCLPFQLGRQMTLNILYQKWWKVKGLIPCSASQFHLTLRLSPARSDYELYLFETPERDYNFFWIWQF